jgi:hypothetical protein
LIKNSANKSLRRATSKDEVSQALHLLPYVYL